MRYKTPKVDADKFAAVSASKDPIFIVETLAELDKNREYFSRIRHQIMLKVFVFAGMINNDKCKLFSLELKRLGLDKNLYMTQEETVREKKAVVNMSDKYAAHAKAAETLDLSEFDHLFEDFEEGEELWRA